MHDLLQRKDLLLYGKTILKPAGYIAGQIELTSDCSQRCAFCDSWRQHVKGSIKGTLSSGDILKIARELKEMGTFEHLSFTGGEPQDWVDPTGYCKSLEDLLSSLQGVFSLQVNTTLCRPLNDLRVWKGLNRIRVSIDAVTPGTYKLTRGVDVDPSEVLSRIERIDNPGLAVNTCVSPLNIDEAPEIIRRLNGLKRPPRKVMMLAVIGAKTDEEFWWKYRELKKIPSPKVETSFAEDVSVVREELSGGKCDELGCYLGGFSFHIKCNGDVYPCCLVGGEAIKTVESFKLGSIYEESLTTIRNRFTPQKHYRSDACKNVCQWKQLQMNKIADFASKTTLTMP